MRRRTSRPSSTGSQTTSAPSSAAQRRCSGCLAAARSAGRGEVAEGGDGEQPEGAGAEDDDRCPADTGGEGAVHPARRRLDHHRGVVAHGVGHGVQLTLVGHHGDAPAAAGRAAEAALQAGLETAEGDAFAVAEIASGARRAGGVDAAGNAAEDGFEHGARSSSRSPTTSWPGVNGKLTMGSK